MRRVKYWEIIADNLSKRRMELGLGFSRGSACNRFKTCKTI
jgi:hypothetical protein